MLGLVRYIGVLILVSFGLLALKGWVVATVWNWFLVPIGAPEIGVIHAIGISVLASLLTHQQPSNDEEDNFLARHVSSRLLFLFLSLLFGLVAVQFVS